MFLKLEVHVILKICSYENVRGFLTKAHVSLSLNAHKLGLQICSGTLVSRQLLYLT